jgi:RNA polymerase sigma-70 factor (ECF subfamily)
MDAPSDEALLAGMADGDRDAAVAFVRRYQARVFGLAVAVLGNRQTAEDVAQEALVRVWRHARAYDANRGSVGAWVATIVRNLAIDAHRVRREAPAVAGDLSGLLAALADLEPAASPADQAVRRDQVHLVARALVGLSSDQRRALLLAAFHGWTAREISEIENIPLGTAKTRIRDGLLRVRAALRAGVVR